MLIYNILLLKIHIFGYIFINTNNKQHFIANMLDYIILLKYWFKVYYLYGYLVVNRKYSYLCFVFINIKCDTFYDIK